MDAKNTAFFWLKAPSRMLFLCNCMVANGFGKVKKAKCLKMCLCTRMENQVILNKQLKCAVTQKYFGMFCRVGIGCIYKECVLVTCLALIFHSCSSPLNLKVQHLKIYSFPMWVFISISYLHCWHAGFCLAWRNMSDMKLSKFWYLCSPRSQPHMPCTSPTSI